MQRKKNIQCKGSTEKTVITSIENVEDENSCTLCYILISMRLYTERRLRRTSQAQKVYNRVPGENFSADKKKS